MARELSYPVWRGPIVIGLIVICCFGWWWWKCPCVSTSNCDCPNYAEVVVDEGCVAMPWDLTVSRGDLVMWTNLMSDTLKVKFTVSTPFAVNVFRVPPGHQTNLLVQEDATIGDHSFLYYRVHDGIDDDCSGGAGGPKVVIGGGGG